jgi:hypothetical protein
LNGERAEFMTELLEALREEIWLLERELGKFGFDSRRGIESYDIAELREVLGRSGNESRARELLLKLIELQERLYKALYELSSSKELNVDTESPEKRLLLIKSWLKGDGATARGRTRSKFAEALRSTIRVLEECEDDCVDKVLATLRTAYKRDYDRHRVVDRMLEMCIDATKADDLPSRWREDLNLPDKVKLLVEHVSKDRERTLGLMKKCWDAE